jgi:RNA polymerase sigma-70 factor (ECF subfamily)
MRGRESSFRDRLRSPDGFGSFYERHAAEVLRFFARRLYDPELAFDLTAETFAQALLSVRRLRAKSEDEAVAWLYGVARHQLTNALRRGHAERRALRRLGVELERLGDEQQTRIEELAGLAELRAAVGEELAGLSESERQAVRLRVVEELSYEEVARRLDVSEVAARARVSRGLRTLGAALEARPLPEEIKP